MNDFTSAFVRTRAGDFGGRGGFWIEADELACGFPARFGVAGESHGFGERVDGVGVCVGRDELGAAAGERFDLGEEWFVFSNPGREVEDGHATLIGGARQINVRVGEGVENVVGGCGWWRARQGRRVGRVWRGHAVNVRRGCLAARGNRGRTAKLRTSVVGWVRLRTNVVVVGGWGLGGGESRGGLALLTA